MPLRLLPLAVVLLAFLSAGCRSARVTPPQVAADTTLAFPPERVYAAAARAAVQEDYVVLSSDGPGGVLRLQRTHGRRGAYRLAYLTVVVSPTAAGTRLMLQTQLTGTPTDSTFATPLREDGTARARAFLARLTSALHTP